MDTLTRTLTNRAQWLLLATILITIAAAVGYAILSQRAEIEEHEQERLLNQTRIIGAYLSQQLAATQHMLEGVRDDLPVWRKSNAIKASAARRLKALIRIMPGIRTINILDAQGMVIASNRDELVGANFSKRDYFQRARSQGKPNAMQLSAPFETVLGAYSMNLVMVIPGPNGEFGGAITATLAPEYFAALLGSVRYAPDMRTTLIHEDGKLFAQVPASIPAGTNLASQGTFFSRHIVSKQAENSYTGETSVHGGKHMVALLTIRPPELQLDKGLVIAGRRDYNAVLAFWQKELKRDTLTLLLVGGLAIVALALAQSRQKRAAMQLARTQSSLDKSEEQFSRLIESAPNPMFLVDTSGQIRVTNHEAEALFGYRRDELIGQAIATIIPHRFRERHAGVQAAFMTTGQTRPMGEGRELFALKRDGTEIRVEVSLNSVDMGGQSAVLATLVDISLRTRIREAMEKLAYLNPELGTFDAIAAAVHHGLRARWCGVGCLSDDGLRVRVIGVWDTGRIGTPFEYAFAGTPCEQSCSHQQPLTIERDVALRFPQDKRLAEIGAVSYRGEPIFNLQGHLTGILFVIDDKPCVEDTTERAFLGLAAKRAASELIQLRAIRELEESEDRFRQLAENIHEVFWVSNVENTKVTYISPAYESVWGRSCAELYANPASWLDAIHPEDRPKILDSAHTQQTSGTYDETYRIIRPDGAIRWIRDRAFVVRDDHGAVTRIVGIAADITADKNAEQEREQLQAQLRQAQKMEAIGQLTGGIAHDFNNILASVLGYTTLTMDRFNDSLPEKARDYLTEVQHAGERARDLVAKMLAYARETSSMPQVLDPKQLVEAAVKMLTPTLPSSIELSIKLDESVPAIPVDPVQFQQVLTNLVINARDATESHGRIRIGVYLASANGAICSACHAVIEGQFVALVVEDDGDGIAPEHLTRIFDPFFTTKEVGKGTGLGLSMVHGIVHEHGGHILVDSVPGHSTTFRVLFPIARLSAETAQHAAVHTAQPGIGQRRILIVDDEPTVASYLTELLTQHGHSVTTFTDSRAAWRFFEDQPDAIDLVITDQTMPHLTGADMAGWMRVKRNNLPIILCTGHSEVVTPEVAARLGIHRFLYKPVAAADLLAAIQEIS